MKMMTGSVLALCALTSSAGAETKIIPANKFVEFCEAPVESGQWSYCLGFFNGFAISDGALTALMQQKMVSGTRAYCIPAEVQSEGLRLVFLKHAEAHPEKLHLDFVALVFDAFMQYFPCK